MILSASGWRKVFAASGNENDTTTEISDDDRTLVQLAADVIGDYIFYKSTTPSIILGIDSRPTGPAIAEAMIRVLMAKKIAVSYAGIIAAPEIMAYSHTSDGFVYISASHNPIGHNGIKFGLNDGGVINGKENAKLAAEFEKRCRSNGEIDYVKTLAKKCSDIDLDWVFAESVAVMREASSIYRSFAKTTIAGTDNITNQNKLFAQIRQNVRTTPLGIVCDMNGSARTLSIDSAFFKECGINFYGINNLPGKIEHAIIPEPENLVWCADEMERLQSEGKTDAILGYMPDCDGDRGNIVYWNEKLKKAEVLKAQEVFALSVLAELAYSIHQEKYGMSNSNSTKIASFFKENHKSGQSDKNALGLGLKLGVAVNCPTSMRIEEIANAFQAEVFRGEVGEANIVNLAREKRSEGYTIRILGEGSNGGNITHPAAVRDPLNTLFALIKLLVIRDAETEDGNTEMGLYHLWCKASGQEEKYKNDFTFTNIIESLPQYTTTGVSEKRAILQINSTDHAQLKDKFQKIFENQWEVQKEKLHEKYGIASYEAIATNGIKETRNLTDFSESGKGGLKILFKDENKNPIAFIWMRGSGTEPVFRVMADVRGNSQNEVEEEKKLIEWETKMLLKADGQI